MNRYLIFFALIAFPVCAGDFDSELNYSLPEQQVEAHSNVETHDFIELGTAGTALKGKLVLGYVTILQKVDDYDYLLSFEFGDYQRTYYLTNAGKLDAVDGQTVAILAKVMGTKSYIGTLGNKITVISLKLMKFTLDGKTAIKAS